MDKDCINKAREYLRNIRSIGRSLEFLEDRISFYEALCEKCTSQISDMPRGNSKSTEDLLAKLVDLKNKQAGEFQENGADYAEASILIESIENKRHKALLYYYYIERWKLREVGYKVGVSYDRVKHLHNDALYAFSKVMKEEL